MQIIKNKNKMSTIIFGTKRLGKEDGSNGSFQKYPNQPVITLEGNRGHGKSRRFLFNEKAAEMLGLEKGAVQQMIFGTYVNGEEKSVLVANANDIVSLEGLTIYKTSKNKVSFDEPSKEKGKAVSSSVITGDITSFLGLDDEKAYEFNVVDFVENEEVDAVKLVLMTEGETESPIGTSEEAATETVEETVEEPVSENDPALRPAEPLDEDPFAAVTPAMPVVEDVNWDADNQPSQASEGLTRATAE